MPRSCALIMGFLACLGASAEPIPVEVALAGLYDAYRSGPVVDRIVVTLIDDRGRRTTERLTVKLDASAPSPIVALDLGRLHVSATDGEFVAVHDTEATTCFTADFTDPVTPDVLAGLLPPLPAPQISLAIGTEPSFATPYAPHIRWSGADHDEQLRPATITLNGQGDQGAATAVIDAATGRLRHFESDIAGGKMKLVLEVSAGDVGADWIIPVGDRRPVARLGDLTRPPRDLRPGDRAPNVKAIDLTASSWSLHAAVNTDSPHPVGMLAFRAVAPGAHADQILRDVTAVRDAVIRVRSRLELDAFRLHAVAVVEQADLELLQSVGIQWVMGLYDAHVDRALPWTQDTLRTIDAFLPDADAVLLLVHDDLRIASIIPVDGAVEDSSLDERLATALNELAPAEPPEQAAPGPESPEPDVQPIDPP